MDTLIKTETRESLANALAALSPEDSRILFLRYAEDKSLREIADEMGIVPATATYRIKRALNNLRRSFNTTTRLGGAGRG